MCGITGFLGGNWSGGGDGARATVTRMAQALAHRGPDAQGELVEPGDRLALGHRRLSIVDLSPAGAQPMISSSGHYALVYNGELYNHPDLRRQLQAEGRAPAWRGHSDTETLLATIDAWGIRTALERLIGMFAIALWDRRDRSLVLARDRLGEKPLFYGWQGTGKDAVFLFGSELKALAQHPGFVGEIDRQSLSAFTRYGYVPAPTSIFAGIRKLLPGTFLTVTANAREPVIERYWSGAEAAAQGYREPLRLTPGEAVDALEGLLGDAVGRQMVADVPLGAFLSGGIDSSVIVALMQARSAQPVRTFSIGFPEVAYNEANHAKAVAQHLGTDHTELYVTTDEALGVIPRLPRIYDEPFADSSQIPTVLVSELAACTVTVSLSGDAGDELFGGYNRYRMAGALWGKLARVPRPLRLAAARGMTAVSHSGWDRAAEALGTFLSSAQVRLPGEKIHKAAGVLASRSIDELYLGLVSQWQDPAHLVIGGTESLQSLPDGLEALGAIERMMASDMLTYLPDDILAKIDRAAMSTSLESRVPFLDHRVVEFAWRLPTDLKLRAGETKWVLRRLLDRFVPRALVDRPKMGFGVPIDSWLRDQLRPWAEALIDPQRLTREGYFDPVAVQSEWRTHCSGRSNRQHRLWTVLMFQQWLEASKALREPPRLAA